MVTVTINNRCFHSFIYREKMYIYIKLNGILYVLNEKLKAKVNGLKCRMWYTMIGIYSKTMICTSRSFPLICDREQNVKGFY